MLKITKSSYVVAKTSKEQKEILDILTQLGYRWTKKLKANEYIPIEYKEKLVVIQIYPTNRLLTAATLLALKFETNKQTELKIEDFKPKVIL